jgi:hypothetical protein
MLCVSVNLTSGEWLRIQQAAGRQFPNENLSRAEIVRRYILAGIQKLDSVSPADQARIAHEMRESMPAPDEKLSLLSRRSPRPKSIPRPSLAWLNHSAIISFRPVFIRARALATYVYIYVWVNRGAARGPNHPKKHSCVLNWLGRNLCRLYCCGGNCLSISVAPGSCPRPFSLSNTFKVGVPFTSGGSSHPPDARRGRFLLAVRNGSMTCRRSIGQSSCQGS